LLSALKTLDLSTMDTNGNGVIELHEFQAHFNELNTALSETIFYDIDGDKDKFISSFEYEAWRNLLDAERLQALRDNYKKYPEPEPEPETEPEPEPQPIIQPKPKPIVYKKPVDDTSLLSILKTMDYESLGNNGKIHWNDFRDYFDAFYDFENDEENVNDLHKVFCDIDKDRDEWISHAEYKEWIGKLNSLFLDKILSGDNKMKKQVEQPKVEYYNNKEDDDEKNGNVDGVKREWSVNQAQIKWLVQTLKDLNIRSLDYGNTNTVQMDAFINYFGSLNRIVPDDVKKQIWEAVDRQKIGRITVSEYSFFADSLDEDKMMKIVLG